MQKINIPNIPDNLKNPLRDHVATLPKTKIIRSPLRIGLIKGKLQKVIVAVF